MQYDEYVKTVAFRLPATLVAEIRREALARGVSKSAVVRDRLSAAVPSAQIREMRFDAIADLVGSVDGLPSDLSPSGLRAGRALVRRGRSAGAVGVVVVVAAGNTGYGHIGTIAPDRAPPASTSRSTIPGNADRAITVGSTHRVRCRTRTASRIFSSKGADRRWSDEA